MNGKTILITNDDGIASAGIRILAEELKSRGAHVVVVAPDREQSAASHAISFRLPLRMKEVAPGYFAVSGTPADCAYMGLFAVLDRRPDLVLSGINDGYNLGTDVYYSGTFAGAFEAALRGIGAMAVSTNRHASEEVLAAVARSAADVSAEIIASPAPYGTVFNLNHPDVLPPKGLRVTSLGVRTYLDEVEKRLDPKGVPYYWIGGPASWDFTNLKGGERGALEEGAISLTPVNLTAICDQGDFSRFESAFDKVRTS